MAIFILKGGLISKVSNLLTQLIGYSLARWYNDFLNTSHNFCSGMLNTEERQYISESKIELRKRT
jgi:hypothetical protein